MSNPFDQFDSIEDSSTSSKNPFDQFDSEPIAESMAQVEGLEPQPEWMIEHLAKQPKSRSFSAAASDTGRSVMKSLAGVADAAMNTADFIDDAVPLGGLTWEEGDVLPSYKTPSEFRALKEQGMTTRTDATGAAMDYWEQGKSAAIKQDAQYLANADGFLDTFKRAAERPRAIGNAIADSIGYMVPGMAAARAAKAAGATGSGITAAVAGTGAVVEGGAARSQAVGEVMDMPLGQLLEHSPDFQALVKSGVDPEAARMRVAADAGFTAQAIAMPVSLLASNLTGAAKAEADFFTGQGARDFFTGLFKQAGEEATQEMGSQFGVNVGVSENADNRRDYTEDLGNAAAMGVIMGPAQQAGMKAVDVASQQLGKVGAAPQDDGDIDLPQNGEEIGGGIVDELPGGKREPLQISHDPQRMIVLPDGTTAWESEAAEMFPPSAANQHPAFPKLASDPDQIEGELTGDTDIDSELRALMAELDQAESIAREASPMVPPEVNPFDQFDNVTQQPEGLFDGIRQAQFAQQEAARTQDVANQEMANANFQEDDERGFMGQAIRLQEQARYQPMKSEVDPGDLADIYPPDPGVAYQVTPAESRISAPIPIGMNDQRLLRPEYRTRLQRIAGELVKGGGVGFVRDENDRIVGRTPSMNAGWFKALGENPETAMSVADTQAAISKALAGERLGVRQVRVVGAALDAIGEERGTYARDIRAMRENARADRRKAFEDWLAATNAPVDAEFEAAVWPDSPGEAYNEDSYLPENSMEDRAISELVQTADGFGVDWADIDSALANEDISSQTQALTQLIWKARNEHRKPTVPAESRPGQDSTEGDSESRPGSSESPIGALEEKPSNITEPTAKIVDDAAAEAAMSPKNDLPEPTEAQKEAGNYRKGHAKIHGLDIAIENPRGSTRFGTDKDGKPWSVTMHNHYGYIKRTEGADGDHVDVFIGPNPESDKVFIVDQVNADGSFDEHKILIGFDSKLKARSGYKSNYSSGWKVGPITSMSMDEFKEWLKSGDTKRPLSPALSDSTSIASAATTGDQAQVESESKSPINESKSRISESEPPKSESELPPILTQSRKQFITAMAKERGLKKDSPGYAGALKQVEADYELELDRAHANLSFDEFNRLNSDSPESVNRQAWESLREEYGTDDTRYSLGNSGGISVKSAQAVIDRMMKSFKNPHIIIRAVSDINGFPSRAKERLLEHNEQNEKDPVTAKALFYDGTIFVNASAVRDANDVERAIFHELHGHYGTRLLFGRETSTAMGRLYLAIGGEKGIRDIAKKHNIDLSKYEEILKGESPRKRAEIVADELLAHIAQDSKPSVKRWLQELIGTIRTWLRAHGFKGLGQFSDSEIMALLKRTREAATELKLEGGSVLRVLRDVAGPDATARTDTAQAAYSLAGLPPNTRKIIGTDPVLAGWTLLAQNDEAFQLPVSEKKSLEDIFSEVAPGIKIRRAPEFDNDGAQVWAVNPKKDTLALVFQKGKSVWIDVADYSPGQSGSEIYNAVANYAHNTGKTFIGDPAGLSDKAMARRLENMISSALKFGTTEHLWPHERQEQGGAGVPPIKWKAGDDAHNLKEMINASYQATLNQFPEIKDLRYNPKTDQIEGVKDGKVYTRADIEKIAKSKRAEATAGGPPITAGGKTLERAILTHTISRGTRQEQFDVLAGLGNQQSQRLARILYSLAPGNDQQTRPSGGFSVSGAMEKMGLGKDNRGASLPPNVRAAYDMLGGKDKTFAEKIKQEVKRQLAPGGLLPREIFDLKIARDAEMNSEDNEQRYILEDFYDQVVKVYDKPYSDLKVATRKEIDDYLKGDRTNVKLTASMVEVLGRMRKHIQNLSARYMDELLLDAASLELQGKKPEAEEKRRLIETITENFNTYLHRSYRAFDDPDWPKKVPPDVYKTAVDYLAKQYAGNNPVSDKHMLEATKKVDLMLHEGTAYDSMARFIAESKLGSKDLSVLKKRKAIAPEIRALLGEYEDPAINYAKSITKMTRLVSNTAFLRQMREASLSLGLLYEEKDRPVGAHKKIAADASEVYSPLNGLYTYPEFEQALRDAVGSNKEPDWYKWIVTANAAVKYGKTVLAPTTAMRNIISASMFSLTSGHWNLAHLGKSLKAVKTYFTAQDVRGSREYINKLLKLGVLYDAPNYRELQDLIKQVNEGESVVAKAMRKSKAATVLNYAQEFYALGDDFWKILGFENEKAMLIKHFNMSEANAEREAAERIRNTYPTYSMTGRGIQTLRRFPLIGSFPSFPAEIIRTTYHKFRYFYQDAKALGYNNPAVLAKGVGLVLGAGMMGAISAVSAAILGVGDDEEEAIRQMLPEWSRNANLLFLGRDDKGQIEYMDLTWIDPYSYWKKPLAALAREKDIDEKAADAAWEALSPFLGLDIAFGAVIQLAKDIANPGVTTEAATDKLAKSLAPGFVSNALGFWNAAHDTVTKSGKKYSFEDEALALIGFRKGTLNAKVGLTYQAYGYQDKKREASTVLREKATNLGKVDIEELRTAYEKSMEMHRDAWNEMRRMVKMATKTGMTQAEAVSALRTSGISLRDARRLVADEEFRYQPPKNMMKLAIKRASILFDEETQQELRARAKSLREFEAETTEKAAR